MARYPYPFFVGEGWVMSMWRASLLTHGSCYEPSLLSATALVGTPASLKNRQAIDDSPLFVPTNSGASVMKSYHFPITPEASDLQRITVERKLPKNGRSCQGKSRRWLTRFSCLTKPRDFAITYLLLDGSLRNASLLRRGVRRALTRPPLTASPRDAGNIQKGRRLRGRPTGRTCGSGP
jgi:hypothetical protein